jgi:hypothetical protein
LLSGSPVYFKSSSILLILYCAGTNSGESSDFNFGSSLSSKKSSGLINPLESDSPSALIFLLKTKILKNLLSKDFNVSF